MSEYKIIKNNSENLIICFGGMAFKMGGILPFEFLNYLSKTFQKKYRFILTKINVGIIKELMILQII